MLPLIDDIFVKANGWAALQGEESKRTNCVPQPFPRQLSELSFLKDNFGHEAIKTMRQPHLMNEDCSMCQRESQSMNASARSLSASKINGLLMRFVCSDKDQYTSTAEITLTCQRLALFDDGIKRAAFQ